MSVRFRICLAVWVATVAVSACCSSARADALELDGGWTMDITPSLKLPPESETAEIPTPPVPEPTETRTLDAQPLSTITCPPIVTDPGSAYRRIYDSIPFNRAEYNANPSYRHDSTMELLTGNPRHQTILTHSTIPGRQPWRRVGVIPYRYNNFYRGLNYYFYFPYWNARGFYLR